jgi:hypothetical protein
MAEDNSRKQSKHVLSKPEHATTIGWVPVITIAGVSAILGFVAAGLTAAGRSNLGAPGWWVASKLGKPGPDLNLGLFIVSAVIVDAVLFYAVLLGGFLLWEKARRKDA